MDFETLQNTPPWEWPVDANLTLKAVLLDGNASQDKRIAAAEFAGDCVVIDDILVAALLSLVRDSSQSDALRATAAVAFGPVLEMADEDDEDVPIDPKTLRKVHKALQAIHEDEKVPALVRRRALEASVRQPQDWHKNAIASAYARGADWKLTAVFCMRYVPGFEAQIQASLADKDPDMLYEAVSAAGVWQMNSAWSVVEPLLSTKTEKSLLLAAIEAVIGIRPKEAAAVLGDLLESDDEEVVEAVHEAIAMEEGISELEEEPEDD